LHCIKVKQHSIYIEFLLSVSSHDLIAKKFSHELKMIKPVAVFLTIFFMSILTPCMRFGRE